jgi:hypothetical protein
MGTRTLRPWVFAWTTIEACGGSPSMPPAVDGGGATSDAPASDGAELDASNPHDATDAATIDAPNPPDASDASSRFGI